MPAIARAEAPAPYSPLPGVFDEGYTPEARPRPHYARVLAALEGVDLEALRRTVAADLSSRGVAFGFGEEAEPFVVDVVPRILGASEWSELSAGLLQRTRALNAFLRDVYGERAIVREGVVPGRVVEGAGHYERLISGVAQEAPPAAVAGLDVVRGADGRFRVLEDNLRTPSGIAYVTAARDVLDERLPVEPPDERASLADVIERLGAVIRAAAPGGRVDPSVVLLSDGPDNSAFYEHQVIARRLDIPIVRLGDLEHSRGGLVARLGGSLVPVDVVYRRTDEDRVRDAHGRPTAIGAVLLAPLQAGRVAVVNAFGNGVADDKLVHAYVEQMVRFYLSEEPLIPSVQTYDLAEPEQLERALDRIGELVVKPRTGYGGAGVVVCAHASPEDVSACVERVRADPEGYVAQETIMLSSHPTESDGRLSPRHVDLRPFVLSGRDGVEVIPGGLTRVALDAGTLVVNSSQHGGGKDTWVLT